MTRNAGVTRRTVLGGAAAVTGAVVLAGCTAGGSDTAGGADSGGGTAGGDTAGTTTPQPSEAAGGGLVPSADVPEGGGVIITDAKVVVTQPTAGEYKAFSSTCTHQGCQVSQVTEEAIVCACHGSRFSLTDGAVLGGPATAPLPEVPISVEGTQVVLA
jgi:Rieske Fe-S protein